MVDGTGVRLQGYKGANLGKGEMRWALASLGEDELFEPVGFWIDKNWREIKKVEQAPLKEKLEAIPVFHFNKGKLEQLSPDDLPRVKALAEKTQQEFQELVDLLNPKKYPKARVYIENISRNIATFFSWWLKM
jgi:tRNA G18 (ribose-2'-O)-methylase SpoU